MSETPRMIRWSHVKAVRLHGARQQYSRQNAIQAVYGKRSSEREAAGQSVNQSPSLLLLLLLLCCSAAALVLSPSAAASPPLFLSPPSCHRFPSASDLVVFISRLFSPHYSLAFCWFQQFPHPTVYPPLPCRPSSRYAALSSCPLRER